MTVNFCSVYKGHFGLNNGHFGKPQRLFWASITVILGDNGHFGCLTVNLVMIFFKLTVILIGLKIPLFKKRKIRVILYKITVIIV